MRAWLRIFGIDGGWGREGSWCEDEFSVIQIVTLNP
jgi:hypothetical protein